jgi:hypothetical protein
MARNTTRSRRIPTQATLVRDTITVQDTMVIRNTTLGRDTTLVGDTKAVRNTTLGQVTIRSQRTPTRGTLDRDTIPNRRRPHTTIQFLTRLSPQHFRPQVRTHR